MLFSKPSLLFLCVFLKLQGTVEEVGEDGAGGVGGLAAQSWCRGGFWQKLHSVLPRLRTASLSPAGQPSGHLSRSHTQALAEKRSGARAGTERLSLLCSSRREHVLESQRWSPHTSGVAGRKRMHLP